MATLACRVQFLDDTDPFNSTNFPEPSRPPLFTFREDLALGTQLAGVHRLLRAPHKLDDCTLQLSHNGAYLDLEATLAEQRDELEGFQDDTGRGKKNSIILRTQLSVRVHACIEKLYNSSGRDLRRALFSLKQIFQDDKDLVHEFVIAEGLTCLIKVGAEADQNYQNYILRALGQIMLYVDGMNGVINHSETIQWLYTLVGSKFRLVVKTALKLLLVFVEYSESNAPLLIQAVSAVDTKRGVKPWSNIMEILEEKDGVDTELLVYAMTLVNKTLAGLPDQDTFYDVVDCLEELGIAAVSQRHLNKKGTDLDLLEQFNIYEVALRHEDGDETAEPPPSGHRDRRRASMCSGSTVGEQQGLDRRRSRRHSIQNIKSPLSAPTSPCSQSVPAFKPSQVRDLCEKDEEEEEEEEEQPITEPNSEEEREDDAQCQGKDRYSNFSNNSFQSSRPSPGPSVSPSSASSFSSPQDTRSSSSGLLTSSFRQHQESLAAERERRRQEREERLQRIEREERDKFNREYLDKREEQRQARGERYKYLEQLAAETQEKEQRSRSVSRGRADLSLDLSLAAAPASPSPSSQSPSSADTQEALPVPSSPPTLQYPQVSGKDHEPELEAEARQGADEASQDIASAHRGAESQEEPVLELEPEERASLSEKERQNEEVNERDNCSAASSISSSSSTLEREEKEDKLSEDRATGLWSSSLQDVGVNGQCGDILTSKRFMLDMLYAHNRKSTEDEEKGDGEPGRSAQEVEAVASLATRISTLQANSQPPEESIKRVGIGCLDNRGSVKAFAEKFNSGEVGRGSISPDAESHDKVPDTPPAQMKTESDYIWDQLMANPRELRIQDMDFTDLGEEDDIDVLDVDLGHREAPGPPPPPPPTFLGLPPPPPPPLLDSVPPPPVPGNLLASPMFNTAQGLGWSQVPRGQPAFTKKKKTIRLFWNEVRPFEWPNKNNRRCREFLWSKLEPIKVDTSRLEHLFESKSKELSVTKKTAADGKRQEIIVLDSKRSNAINIGLTVLPPPRTIKIAILNFDEYALNKEGIEKILTMIPTEEEKQKIQEAQLANPEVPLGSAEQFLLTLSSISELSARLHLWAFKMDYETTEKEVAEPLLDLKEGIDQLENNKTLGFILSTLLAIGNFLNGTNAKAFELSYLEKVPEVKDTVHKQSLLHHVCTMVVENFPDSSDLYSEIGAITRSAKVDFDQLQDNLCQMERRCKASWDHLKAIAKHEMKPVLKQRMSEFLKDCAERIIILKIVHRRIINRFHSFLLFMGHPPYAIREVNINKFCRIISEFALEYRTTRERVLQQKQKRANHRERNKTRGKMITDTDDEDDTESGKFSGSSPAVPSQPQGLSYAEDAAEHENMKAVLKTSSPALEDATPVLGVRTRSRASRGSTSSWTMATEESPSVTDDAADEIMDRIVKSATQVPSQRVVPRERKRSRANRKSLRRTLKSGLTPEEARALGLVGTSELQL
ncbi:FH1/FH2 domain-containing protein 3 isoform X3 [Mastomys coucha]|uniref:FH1/FH2 domain-containing protein 3 isoform X3 n=1 Tax=Mastomys coucha TaxID=35658 RepID=UPI0012614CB8|nr:FH1/FH2 domain-containing protein 3 isoform X3 [Mastomys coucha]